MNLSKVYAKENILLNLNEKKMKKLHELSMKVEQKCKFVKMANKQDSYLICYSTKSLEIQETLILCHVL